MVLSPKTYISTISRGAMPYTATVLDLFTRNAESLFSAIEPLD